MSQKPAIRLFKMASGKAKGVDEMTFMELCEMMKALGLSDEGVMELKDARSLIKSTIKAEKTTNWSPGKVRYLLVKFQNEQILARVFNCLHERYLVITISHEAMRGYKAKINLEFFR